MKKIKLPNPQGWECSVDEKTAREIIASMQAQLAAPEPVEFWEGQIITANSISGYLNKFRHMSDDGKYCICKNGDSLFRRDCRPLQDPLIDQYKPLANGELIPLEDTHVVRVKFSDGSVSTKRAGAVNNTREHYRAIGLIGYMPASGWGRSE